MPTKPYKHQTVKVKTFVFAVFVFFFTCDSISQTNSVSAPWVGSDLAGSPCTGPGQGYGPYNYLNPAHRGENLRLVESAHFTKKIESLSGRPAMDLDYTLRAFPNHHRALYAMMRFQIKEQRLSNARYAAIECYFQRAIKFSPNDFRVMQLYANYLTKKDHPKMAERIYKRALTTQNAPVDINYALGLLYLKMNEYDKAVDQAKIVYGSGFKKSKLARELKKANRWPIK